MSDLASWLLEQIAETESHASDHHDQLCETTPPDQA